MSDLRTDLARVQVGDPRISTAVKGFRALCFLRQHAARIEALEEVAAMVTSRPCDNVIVGRGEPYQDCRNWESDTWDRDQWCLICEAKDAILAAEPSPVDAAAREKELRDLARLTCVRCFDGHPHTDVSMMFHANGIMPTVHDYCPARFIHQALAAKEEADADAD